MFPDIAGPHPWMARAAPWRVRSSCGAAKITFQSIGLNASTAMTQHRPFPRFEPCSSVAPTIFGQMVASQSLAWGAAKGAVSENLDITLRIEHLPLEDDESHAGIFGYAAADIAVAVELAVLIADEDVCSAAV